MKRKRSMNLLDELRPETVADLAIHRLWLKKPARFRLPSIPKLLRMPKYELALRQRVEQDLSYITGVEVRFRTESHFAKFLDHRAGGFRFVWSLDGLLGTTFLDDSLDQKLRVDAYLEADAVLWAFLFEDGEDLADAMAAVFQRMFFALVEHPEFEGLEIEGNHDPQAHQQNWANWSAKWSSERRERMTPRVNGLTWLQFYRAWFDPRKRLDKSLRERATRGRQFFASQDRLQLKTVYFPPIMERSSAKLPAATTRRDYDAQPLTREEMGVVTEWLVRRDAWNTGVISLPDPGLLATKYFRSGRRSPFVLRSFVTFGKEVSTPKPRQ